MADEIELTPEERQRVHEERNRRQRELSTRTYHERKQAVRDAIKDVAREDFRLDPKTGWEDLGEFVRRGIKHMKDGDARRNWAVDTVFKTILTNLITTLFSASVIAAILQWVMHIGKNQ